MPHLKIDYSANLDEYADMAVLCRSLSAALAGLRDVPGQPLFPLAGTRVMAAPAPHHAVAGGRAGYAFVYLNLRITPGRDKALIAHAGAALLATVEEHFGALMRTRPIGITLHIDETAPAYEGKYSNLASHLAAEG
ncbi:MAG: 5-carboxymethyl-2-hydroxymuconate isomerase [Massilia sp.]|nr:5-carboxymethyl-2-hydroxymuconate isomerase [Massilia sp.]